MNRSAIKRPWISIVVPTYNRADWVGGAIQSLLSQKTFDAFDYELIVVDNASTDDTRFAVESAIADSPIPAKYVYSSPPGDAPTRNAGVRQAKGDWVAFFDDDQLATPDWLYQLLQAAHSVNGQIVGGPVHLDLTEEQLRALGKMGRKALREIDYYPTLQPYSGNKLPGTGNALVARQLFEDVGMFDESMGMGGSDFDFFVRARDAGVELWYTPNAIIRHRIEPNRLTVAYHRWDALSGSSMQAQMERREKGTVAVVTLASARMGQMALVSMPMMAWGWVKGDQGEVLSRRIQAWRALGYMRGTLKSLAPSVFPQTRFFESLEFRNGRDIGKEDADNSVSVDESEARLSPCTQHHSVGNDSQEKAAAATGSAP